MGKIPKKLEGGYSLVREYSIEDLERFKDHTRMSVFYNKGTQCVVPGCIHNGVYLLLVEETNSKSKARHINLYSQEFALMTVDHILPKSRKGKKTLENLQPMCAKHNQSRGNMPYERFLAGERIKVLSWKVNEINSNCIEGYYKGRLFFILELFKTLSDVRGMYEEPISLPIFYKIETRKEGLGLASDLLNDIDVEIYQNKRL